VKVKLAVIIILSLAIGVSYTIAYQQYRIVRKEADNAWGMVQQIEQQKENKKDVGQVVGGESVVADSTSTTNQDTPEATGEPKNSPTASENQVAKIIYETAQKRNFPDPGILVRIAEAESSFNTCTKNPNSSALGVFQILDMHGLSREERCNPEIATIWAVDHFAGGRPWASSKSKWQ